MRVPPEIDGHDVPLDPSNVFKWLSKKKLGIVKTPTDYPYLDFCVAADVDPAGTVWLRSPHRKAPRGARFETEQLDQPATLLTAMQYAANYVKNNPVYDVGTWNCKAFAKTIFPVFTEASTLNALMMRPKTETNG